MSVVRVQFEISSSTDLALQGYTLIDSGYGRKLERFGPYSVSRPADQALWSPKLDPTIWQAADVSLTHEGEKVWHCAEHVPMEWNLLHAGLIFRVRPNDFGNLGMFPEQSPFWEWTRSTLKTAHQQLPPESQRLSVLNLFAYSGGMTLAAAQGGAQVCHLDASKAMVTCAKEAAGFNGLENAPIRWIVDDVGTFIQREVRRERRYDAIILDPPTFGRGARGEVFQIEEQLLPLLETCRKLLSETPLFLLVSCHTPGITPIILQNLLEEVMQGFGGSIDCGELCLQGPDASVVSLPSGAYARWQR